MKIKIPKTKKKWTDAELLAWAQAHPVGTRVRYWPCRDYPDESRDTAIRSEPWRLGHGVPIVKIEGTSGGVALDHLTRLPEQIAEASRV